MNILIAEDDAVSRLLLTRTLQKWGHNVTSCGNGEEAWETYQSGDYRIIISDWMMPGLDGPELCGRIRSSPRSEYCYFILLTSRIDKKDYLGGMEAGADDYLTKPFDPDEVRARLRVAERILALQADVQVLRGILPVCAWCKSIRDDDKFWYGVEAYMSNHSAAEISHSICPACLDEHEQEYEDTCRVNGSFLARRPPIATRCLASGYHSLLISYLVKPRAVISVWK